MKKMLMTALAMAAGASFAGIYGDTPDAKHAWAVHDWNRPKPSKVEPAAQISKAMWVSLPLRPQCHPRIFQGSVW